MRQELKVVQDCDHVIGTKTYEMRFNPAGMVVAPEYPPTFARVVGMNAEGDWDRPRIDYTALVPIDFSV
jgi:hypothetical protein